MEESIEARRYFFLKLKLNALNYSSFANKQESVVGHRSRTEDVVFQENPSNARKEIADNVPCTVRNVLCVVNLQVL